MSDLWQPAPRTRTGHAPLPDFTDVIPVQLPARRVELVGRDAQLRQVCDLLANPAIRVVTLTGFGGIGKTTLALQAAYTLMRQFPGGVFFIDLSGLTQSAFILQSIAWVLDVSEEPGKSLHQSLHDFLSNRQVLLILDNCEQVLEGIANLATLLDTLPNLKLLATSRESLRLRGEQILPLTALDLPAARELFVRNLRLLDPSFELDADDDAALTDLCRLLDGMPLSIELAARRAGMFSLPALLARLSGGQLDVLSGGARDLPERQRTLRNTIAWSYSLLTGAEQRAFRAASLFQDGFNLEGLGAVLGESEAQVWDWVASLVEKSLLYRQNVERGVPRFTMQEVLREYAAEQVRALGEQSVLTESFTGWFAQLSRQGAEGLKSRTQAEWLSRLDVEHANLLYAINLGLSAAPGQVIWLHGLDILTSMHRFWVMGGYLGQASAFVQRGRAALEDYFASLPPHKQEDVYLMRLRGGMDALSGSLAWHTGQFMRACELHQSAFLIYQKLNDVPGMAQALTNRAVNLSMVGEDEQALACYEQGQSLYRQSGDLWGEVLLLNNMARTLINLRRLDETRQCYERGLAGARAIQDNFFIGMFLHNMGDLAFRMNRYREALDYFRQALAVSESLRNSYSHACGQVLLALTFSAMGQRDEAMTALMSVSTVLFERADADLRRISLEAMISILVRSGNFEAASTLIGVWRALVEQSRGSVDPFETLAVEALEKEILCRGGRTQHQAALARGAQMSATEALQYGAACLEAARAALRVSNRGDEVLSSREREVLALLAQGKTNHEIAQALVVTLKTVEKHVSNILGKLGVSNRTEAAAWALKNGIK